MNVTTDRRGIQRGRCSNCDCDSYELPLAADTNTCAYCGCPPTAHVRITGPSE